MKSQSVTFVRTSVKNCHHLILFSRLKFSKSPASAIRKWLLSIVAVLALVLGCLVTPRSASALRPSAGAPASTLSASPDPQPARVGKREAKEVAVSPDGRTLAVAASTGLYFYDTTSLAEVRFIPTDAVIYGVAFSPNGRFLASAAANGSVRLWDAQRGELVQMFEGHTGFVNSVAFSRDGRLLASGYRDGSIRLWDAQRRLPLRLLGGQKEEVNCMAFSPDGRLLASGSQDGSVWLWDVARGALVRTLEGRNGAGGVLSVAFSPDGRLIAAGYQYDDVRLWDAQTGQLVRTLEGEMSVAFSPDGQRLAAVAEYGAIRIWDVTTGQLLRTLAQGSLTTQNRIVFSPDGRALAD